MDETKSPQATRGTPPIRYACWLPGEKFGGCETYALAVAERALALGWQVMVLCQHRSCADEVRARLPAARTIEFVRPGWLEGVPGRDRFLGWWETMRCLLFIAAHRPALLHLVLPWHIHSLGCLRAASWARQPAVVTLQLVAAGHVPTPAYRAVYRRAHAAGVRFCAISEDNRRLLAAYYGFAPETIAVIPNRPRMMPAEGDGVDRRRQTRERLAIKPREQVILTVGQLHRQKGHDLIVRGLPEIVRRFSEVMFVWAGDGAERSRLTEAIARTGVGARVRILGWRNDVADLLGAADLFLFPTRFEGESFALMEAIAAGVPVVAAAASGIPELLRDGEEARLFPVDDVAGMVACVTEVLGDPLAAAERARRARVRLGHYTHEHMLEDTLALLRNTVRTRERAGD